MTLNEFFLKTPRAAVAFSGGTDSSYLLYAACAAGADIRAYYVKTPFQPQFELDDAIRLAEEVKADLTIIEFDILTEESIAENPKNRCYHCKRRIFEKIQKQALLDGYSILIDGTNASDDVNDRPGMRAIEELSVKSPLRICGLTKDKIRVLSKEAGLFTWDKPAYACLATRIPEGSVITRDMLLRLEQAENALRELGFTDFRIRLYHDAARLQFTAEQMSRVIGIRAEIIKALKPYFNTVLLDLKER